MVKFIDVVASHAKYEEHRQTPEDRIAAAVSSAFDDAVDILAKYIPGFEPAMDDRAEELVAALMHYIDRSQEGK